MQPMYRNVYYCKLFSRAVLYYNYRCFYQRLPRDAADGSQGRHSILLTRATISFHLTYAQKTQGDE